MRYSAHTGQTSDNGEASRPRASHNHPSDAYSLAAVNRKRAEWASPTNIPNEAAEERRVTPAQLGHHQREADAEEREEHLKNGKRVKRLPRSWTSVSRPPASPCRQVAASCPHQAVL